MTAEVDRRLRQLRPPKEPIVADRPLGVTVEPERTASGTTEETVTVFLAGSECPFHCVFCDLWRYTLDAPTPPGALPRQLELALGELPEPRPSTIKLYNASNFFDRRAVPREDLPRLQELLAPFERVVVECHPRLVDGAVPDFAAGLAGRLEVAMGLETVCPEALPRLNKRMSLEDFDRAAHRLQEWGVGLRAFVLVGAPFVRSEALVDWVVVTAAYALERGARLVSLIPVRGGNGELERLAAIGAFREPGIEEIEAAFDRSLRLGGGLVQLDLWEIERFARCERCRPERLERLRRMNLSGRVEPRLRCSACGEGSGRR